MEYIDEEFPFDDEPPEEEKWNVRTVLPTQLVVVQEPLKREGISHKVLLEYALNNPKLWTKAVTLIKPEHFNDGLAASLKFILEFQHRYHKVPPAAVIFGQTGVMFEVPADVLDPRMEEWACNEIEAHIRHRESESFFERAWESSQIDHSRENIQALNKEFEKITKISMNRDLGIDVHTSMGMLRTFKNDDGIPTGFKHLDLILDGGVSRPSFNMLSMSSGDGKSVGLQNLAINRSLAGENVILFTLELEPKIIMKRFAAMMTGTAMKCVYAELDQIEVALNIRSRTEGRIRIIKMPMHGTTVADLKAAYFDLTIETGLRWGTVIADYIDIMEPIEKVSAENVSVRDRFLAQEMNNFFHEENLIGWSASQQVKGAREELEARQSGVSGGTHKVNTLDFLAVGKRSAEDREEGLIWLHLEKTRNAGGDGKKIPIAWHKETLHWDDVSDEMFAEVQAYIANRAKLRDSRLAKDAIAQELGVKPKINTPTLDGKSKTAEAVIADITRRISRA